MEKFASLYGKLDRQCSYYSRHLGHLKGLLENDDWSRIVDRSMSGRPLMLGNSEIINALVLFNTRMFDRQTDTITVRKLCANIPTEQEIEQHHADRMSKIGIEYELERYYSARLELISGNRELKRHPTICKLKSLRDYTLAHNIEPENKPDKATLSDLLELTEAVNGLVDLAGYIVVSSRGVYRGLSERADKETRMMLAALPALADVEKE